MKTQTTTAITDPAEVQAFLDSLPPLYANYRYTLTSRQQGEIQNFLRLLPPEYQASPAWKLLHDCTYADSWSEEPAYDPPETD